MLLLRMIGLGKKSDIFFGPDFFIANSQCYVTVALLAASHDLIPNSGEHRSFKID